MEKMTKKPSLRAAFSVRIKKLPKRIVSRRFYTFGRAKKFRVHVLLDLQGNLLINDIPSNTYY